MKFLKITMIAIVALAAMGQVFAQQSSQAAPSSNSFNMTVGAELPLITASISKEIETSAAVDKHSNVNMEALHQIMQRPLILRGTQAQLDTQVAAERDATELRATSAPTVFESISVGIKSNMDWQIKEALQERFFSPKFEPDGYTPDWKWLQAQIPGGADQDLIEDFAKVKSVAERDHLIAKYHDEQLRIRTGMPYGIQTKLFASLFWSIVVGLLARRKNLNPWGWGIAGAASWFIALVFLAFQPYRCIKCKRVVEKSALTGDGCMTCSTNALQGTITGGNATIAGTTTLNLKHSEVSLVQTLLMPLLLVGAMAVAMYFVYRPSDRSVAAQHSGQTAPSSNSSKNTGGAELPPITTTTSEGIETSAKELKKPPSTQSQPIVPSINVETRQATASSANDLEKQIVQFVKRQIKSGAILTKSDHAEFWKLMNQFSIDEQSQIIKIASVSLAEGLKLNLALIDSALISARHGKVVKTAEFIEVQTESRKVFLTTLPSTLAPMQREAAVREYEAKRLVADNNNEEFLRSAALGRPHKVANDHFIATDVESLRSYSVPIQQSMLRLNRLLNPTWKAEAIAEQNK